MSTAPADTTTADTTAQATAPAAEEASLPMVLTTVEAVEVTRLSPSYVRVCFAGDLADLGVDGPWLDQRGKLVWEGTMETPSPLNEDVTTAFPVDEAMGKLEPGLYVCGDHRDSASIQGALVSGRRAATA